MKWYQILWELPQHIIGSIKSKAWKCKEKWAHLTDEQIAWIKQFEQDNNVKVYVICRECKKTDPMLDLISGSSLSHIICVTDRNLKLDIPHEYGHCLQSKKRGWLYLLVIGIPSICNNLRGRKVYKDMTYEEVQKDYYNRYPEKEADELGGVVWVDGVRVVEKASVDAR